MRRLLHGDLTAVACALLSVSAGGRAALLSAILTHAEEADAHRQETGRAHPRWGDGSLMALALPLKRASEPFLDDPDYAACVIMVLEAVQRQRRGGVGERSSSG